MIKYIIKRILYLIPILIGVTFLTFLMLYLAPSDPISMKYTSMATVGDTKYYYNYDYDKSSLKIDKGIKAKVNFFTNDKIKFYFNLVSPEEYEVTFEWKI